MTSQTESTELEANADLAGQNERFVMRCPVCEPLSYYGGKSGLDEKETSDMCDVCFKELANLLVYMATETGDSNYITDKSPIISKEHRRIIHAYLAGSELPYIICEEPAGNWKIEKLCGIPLGA